MSWQVILASQELLLWWIRIEVQHLLIHSTQASHCLHSPHQFSRHIFTLLQKALPDRQWRWQHIVTSFDLPGLLFRVSAPNPEPREFQNPNQTIRRLTRTTFFQATYDYSQLPVLKRARRSTRIASSPRPARRLSRRCSKRKR